LEQYIPKNQPGFPARATQRGMLYLTDIYDTPPGLNEGPPPPLSRWAHHVHLRWLALNNIDSSGTLRAVLNVSTPIWRANPALHVVSVDVSSKPLFGSSQARTGVRRYHMQYQDNVGGTRFRLSKIELEGACGTPEDPATFQLPDVELGVNELCPVQ